MKLEEYCNKYFKEIGGDMANHFFEEFGVKIKKDRPLYLFKYSGIEGKFSKPLTHECRGKILQHKGLTSCEWSLVSYPFNKFFNLHEGHCPIDWDHFNENISQYRLVEKADGTCMQLYWYDGDWKVSTLGTISYAPIPGLGTSFQKLFWKTVGEVSGHTVKDFKSKLEKGKTYIFELCTPYNQVVTEYPEKRLYLIGIRDLTGGHLHSWGELESAAIDLGIHMPQSFCCYENDVSSGAAIRDFAEQSDDLLDNGSKVSEGFVLYWFNKPVAKIKNENYLYLHRAYNSNVNSSAKFLIQATLEDRIDDVPNIPELFKCVPEYVEFKVNDLLYGKGQVIETVKRIRRAEPSTQKEYALLVQESVPRDYQYIFFKNKDKVLSGHEYWFFLDQLEDDAEKFSKKWKDEVVEYVRQQMDNVNI